MPNIIYAGTFILLYPKKSKNAVFNIHEEKISSKNWVIFNLPNQRLQLYLRAFTVRPL